MRKWGHPHRMLGPHATEEGLLIQAFIPTATAITVKLTGNGKKYPMELADEAGFYAVLIRRNGDKLVSYKSPFKHKKQLWT